MSKRDNNSIKTWTRIKWISLQIWITMENSFVKLALGSSNIHTTQMVQLLLWEPAVNYVVHLLLSMISVNGLGRGLQQLRASISS